MEIYKRLRMVISSRGWVAAWFPGEELDVKLFWDASMEEVAQFMYARRLRKKIFRGLQV